MEPTKFLLACPPLHRPRTTQKTYFPFITVLALLREFVAIAEPLQVEHMNHIVLIMYVYIVYILAYVNGFTSLRTPQLRRTDHLLRCFLCQIFDDRCTDINSLFKAGDNPGREAIPS